MFGCNSNSGIKSQQQTGLTRLAENRGTPEEVAVHATTGKSNGSRHQQDSLLQ